MPGLTPTRTEVSDRFPVLGFRVRTGRNPYYEVAVATDPTLFRAEAKAQRSSGNFYSSRNAGPLQAEHGESIFFIPPHVLRHFAGKERLYFSVAAFPDTSRANPEVLDLPDDVRPWVTLSKSFTGRETRRMIGAPSHRHVGNGGNGYGSQNTGSLTWAGDDAVPGVSRRVEPTSPGMAPVNNPPSQSGGSTKDAVVKSSGPSATNGAGKVVVASSYETAKEFEYDDGYDPGLWAQQQPGTNKRIRAKAAGDSGSTLLAPWSDVAWDGVELIGERDDAPAWIAAAAMLAGWRDHISLDPSAVARKLGPIMDRSAIAIACNFDLLSGAAYSVTELHDQVANYGPLWAAANSASDPHAFIITCVCGDGTEDGTRVGIMDPWGKLSGSPKAPKQNPTPGQGSSYTLAFRELAAQYDPRMVPNSTDATHVSLQFMRSKTTEGHQPLAACNPVLSVAGSVKRATALDAAQSFDESWTDVDLLGQPTNASCWATAGAIVYGWQNQVSISPETIASLFGRDTSAGLAPSDRKALADTLGLVSEPPQCYSVDRFRGLLENHGPLWVGIHTDDGWNHAVVVTGMYGDGSPDGTFVRINDPWGRTPGTPAKPGSHNPTPGQGSQYTLPFNEFMKEYEDRMTTTGDNVNIQIVHAADMQGRQITSNVASRTQGYTKSLGYSQAAKKQKHLRTERSLQVAVIPVVATIAGTVLTRVLSNEGDVKWELDQLKGLKHVRDDAANQGSEGFVDRTISVPGPVVENYLTDQIYANFEVHWQSNGHSLGNITISDTQTNDAVAWGLEIKANINDDAKVYATKDGKGECAGVFIRFNYRFTRVIGSDKIAILDLSLHGDGTFTSNFRWTQD